ncbi:MAG: MFS transporter, partial [Lysobacter sp.]
LTFIPLVLVVMSIVYTFTAYPAGRLSDSLSRSKLLALGMAVLAAADVALALADGYGLLFAGIALWGLHLGLTQGILASMIADVAPAAYRGTAFGMFNLLSGAGLLAASGVAGWLWDRHGPATTFWAGTAVAGIAVIATLFFSDRRAKASG